MLAVLAAILVPLSFSESDAVVRGDINVSIPDYDVTVKESDDGYYVYFDTSVENGMTLDIPIYIMNISDKYLYVSGNPISNDCLTVEGSADNSNLGPSDGKNHPLCIITMSVTPDLYAKNSNATAELVINIHDHFAPEETLSIHIVTNVEIVSTFYSEDSYNKIFGVIPNTLPEPFNSPWVSAILTVIGWFLISLMFVVIIAPVVSRLIGFKKSDDERKKVRKDLSRMVIALIFILAINQCLGILGTGPELTHFIGAMSNVIYVIIIAAIVWQIYMVIIHKFFTNAADEVDVKGFDSSLIPLFKMLGKIIIGIGAVTAILASFGVDLAGILVSAGVVTLGITLGAQSTLAQFFSGIVLLATRPFQRGDFVKIGTETYIVRNVKLMFTEFENWDKDRVITMPNNMVATSTMVNLTKGSPRTKIFVYISVAYGADLTLAKELMIQAAKMNPHVITDDPSCAPGTRLTNFLDSGIEYRLACTVDDFDGSGNYAGQIREVIYKLFVDNGVEIPYNRLEVTMLEPCDGKKKESDHTDD